ncbi:glycosyltransferase [Sinanaerobacter sp. ZZT-01]|uniref:glycosyltransferase n=1 Tax=Sinanaerobacter sp. ZZT-01 TaxID=3111540 RepID=UPI002D79E630|nr:glycosyltransferase [Sinanaerobacter sp. ZZT-01]WRR93006.1 glycosyltransferase [Sinanaerobacter sp. ZZT-01]
MKENILLEKEKMKLAIFVKKGMDHFIEEIADKLSGIYDTKKVVISGETFGEMDQQITWADICWFEWCDELIAYGSRHPAAINKKIVCRIHSYEIFTDYPLKVNWGMVDRVIFVAKHIRDQAVEKFGIAIEKTTVIPNGVTMSQYTFNERRPGFHIAYVGYINYKKGPMLLLQTFKAIYDTDSRYKLYIAGRFQDDRDVLYFKQMIQEWRLEKNIIYEGWQDNLDSWLEDKDYILCTSILESQNMSVMQAMSKGIKPIIHNFVGARGIYPKHLIFNTIKEAVDMLSQSYNSISYKNYVQEKYSSDYINDMLLNEMDRVCKENLKEPIVSIVMTVYNREKYLKEAIESVLKQSYQHIELIIVNDGSTDDSEKIAKGFSDDRIQYFYKENTGQLSTLKYGLEKAKGKFLTRVDSDDLIDKEYIRTCLDVMLKDSNLKFVYTDMATIDSEGRISGETRFKDYESSTLLLMDVVSGFSSVIPDVSFFREDYISNVILNYAEQNVPFYIDNILTCKFMHIKKPMYFYRHHESNFASNHDNFMQVVEGKIKFEDLLFRRYFIQMNLNKDFLENRKAYYKLFSEYFTQISQNYQQIEAAQSTVNSEKAADAFQMFQEASLYWKNRIEQTESSNSATELLEDNRNQRVLLVSTDDPREGSAVGGKHTHIHLLVKGIHEQNIPCKLVTYQHNTNTLIDKTKAIDYLVAQLGDNLSEGISPEKLEKSSDHSFIYLIYSIQKQLEDKIEKALVGNYYSFISCQDVIAAMAAHRVIKRLHFTLPIVTTLHGYFTDENVDYGGLKKGTPIYHYFLQYEKISYEISDRIITVDTRIKEYVTNLKLNPSIDIAVLKNAADDVLFNAEKGQSDENIIGDDLKINSYDIANNIILIPRRLVPKNGVIYAVKAAGELIKRGITDFKLVIAGDGIERTVIQEYVDRHEVITENPKEQTDECKNKKNLNDFVTLLGNVPHNEIQKIYKKAKVILIPSIRSNNVEEATSIALLEGMACGKVVIASEIGGMKEIIENGKNGFLVKAGDAEALADQIVAVLKMDDVRYNKIGKQARLDVERQYGYKGHAKKYMNLVEGKKLLF